MVFRRKKFSTAEEILDLIKSDNEIMHSTAVIYFHRSDKVSGKLYLRKGTEAGLVYAAHVSNMPFEIGKRLKPYLDSEDYEDIIRQVGGDETDPNIARLVVSRQLVSEKVVELYIREYLFSAATEIFSWEEVVSKWDVGVETRDFASKQHIKLELLQHRAKERQQQYLNMINDTKLGEEQVDSLKVIRKGTEEDFAEITNENLVTIIREANGKNTVADIRLSTGMLKIPAFMSIYSLWKAGLIQLVAGDIPVYPPVDEEEDDLEETPLEVIVPIPLDVSLDDGKNTVSEPIKIEPLVTEAPTKNQKYEETDVDDEFIIGETVPDVTHDDDNIAPIVDTVDEEPHYPTETNTADSTVYTDNSYESDQSVAEEKSELQALLDSFARETPSEDTYQEENSVMFEDQEDVEESVVKLEPIVEDVPEIIAEPIIKEANHDKNVASDDVSSSRESRRAERSHTSSKKETTTPISEKETMTTSTNGSSIISKLDERISNLQETVDNAYLKIQKANKELSVADNAISEKEAQLKEAIEYKEDLKEDLKEYQEKHEEAKGKIDELLETINKLIG